MQAIIFCGIQATGKSTYYKQNYFNTHVRVSLDLLRTRNRENRLIDFCLDTQMSFVVDNTNPSREDRKKYIEKIKNRIPCEIICIYFQSKFEDCIMRNNSRTGKEKVPEIGIKSTLSKLEIPSADEGFDQMYYVQLEDNQFAIKNWEP